MKKFLFVVLLCVSIVGCVERKKRDPCEDCNKKDDFINLPQTSAETIHRHSAMVRADINFKIAAAIESGQLKTVNDVVDFSNPMYSAAALEYIKSINELRKSRLNGAEEELPPNAAAVFKQFGEEYRKAGEPSGKR